jgi:hypothetical protein
VKGDPEIQISDADARARFALLEELHRLDRTLATAGEAAGAMHGELLKIKGALKDSAAVPAPVKAAHDDVLKAMEPIRAAFNLRSPDEPFTFDMEIFRKYPTFKMMMVKGGVMGATMRPTAIQLMQAEELKRQVPELVAQVNAARPKYQELLKQLAAAGLYPKVPAEIK